MRRSLFALFAAVALVAGAVAASSIVLSEPVLARCTSRC